MRKRGIIPLRHLHVVFNCTPLIFPFGEYGPSDKPKKSLNTAPLEYIGEVCVGVETYTLLSMLRDLSFQKKVSKDFSTFMTECDLELEKSNQERRN